MLCSEMGFKNRGEMRGTYLLGFSCLFDIPIITPDACNRLSNHYFQYSRYSLFFQVLCTGITTVEQQIRRQNTLGGEKLNSQRKKRNQGTR